VKEKVKEKVKEQKELEEIDEDFLLEQTKKVKQKTGTPQRSEEIEDLLREKNLLDVEVNQNSEKEKEESEKLFGEVKLNQRYTFNNFVVGPNSRFTHAAALAVAENPGKIYNPLFIYGGVGLGKTHLLHAIGHFARGENKNLKVLYITAEKFIEDVIDAIRQGTVKNFRSHCRKFDILLVDDIQFLAEAESTQEEFFHTFNILYDEQKQIVITSDKPPKKLVDVEERLKSRFEWGLTADIKSPNLETRVAILKKKEEAQNMKLDDDILLYIAGRLKSNIRELEGFLKRIEAYVQLTKQEVNLETIKTLLEELLPSEKESPEEGKQKTEIKEKSIEEKEKKRAEEFLEREVFSFKDKRREPEQKYEEKPEEKPEKKPEEKPEEKSEKKPEKKPEEKEEKTIEEKPIEKVSLVEEIYSTQKATIEEVTTNGKTVKVVKVGYFYPQEHEEELKKIKKEFESVIEKHKLKFQLKAVFEKEYIPYEKVEYKFFVDLCKKAGLKIVIVLGPPKGKELKEAEFSTGLNAFLSDAKISLQFVPFADIGKQFRFLNLVLDIVLVSHKK
ncbi:chromosomal replication initiator protein DnaA, partial [bacterium]|nr:chromosomal replication initiator protein DnaA [bacterium]